MTTREYRWLVNCLVMIISKVVTTTWANLCKHTYTQKEREREIHRHILKATRRGMVGVTLAARFANYGVTDSRRRDREHRRIPCPRRLIKYKPHDTVLCKEKEGEVERRVYIWGARCNPLELVVALTNVTRNFANLLICPLILDSTFFNIFTGTAERARVSLVFSGISKS